MLTSVDRPTSAVRSQVLFREVNDRIRDVRFAADEGGRFEALCECGDAECTAVVPICVADYEAVRAHPRRFVVVPGHMDTASEQLVAENGQFAVVESLAPPPHP